MPGTGQEPNTGKLTSSMSDPTAIIPVSEESVRLHSKIKSLDTQVSVALMSYQKSFFMKCTTTNNGSKFIETTSGCVQPQVGHQYHLPPKTQ